MDASEPTVAAVEETVARCFSTALSVLALLVMAVNDVTEEAAVAVTVMVEAAASRAGVDPRRKPMTPVSGSSRRGGVAVPLLPTPLRLCPFMLGEPSTLVSAAAPKREAT